MVITILNYYFAINLLLILSYFFFKVARRALEYFKLPFSYLNMNRIAQLLVTTAIASPILFSSIPQSTVPDFKFEFRAPLPDSISTMPFSYRNQSQIVAPRENESHFPSGDRTSKINLASILSVLMIIGFILFFVRLAKDLFKLRTIIEDAILIRQIGSVRILVSDKIRIPFSTLAAHFTKITADVVLPIEVVNHAKDLRMIVRHELQHHRNRDTLWILLMEMTTCCYFFNPFIFLWKKEIAEIQEFACDEMLISQMRVSPREYGQCLIKIAEASREISSAQVGTACMGAGPWNPLQLKSFLRRRIEVFQEYKKIRKTKQIGFAIGTLGLILTAGAAYGAQKSLRASDSFKPNSGTFKFDPVIQKATEEILSKHVSTFGAKGGFVLVADSQTGRLLAVANQISDAEKRNRAWALSYEMEPASAMKGLVTALALEHKLIKADETLNCENGKYNYGGREYRDWKGFTNLTATKTVSNSSNICGIKIGQRLKATGLENLLKEFGFGPQGTAAVFPEAKPGRYPKVKDLRETDYVSLVSLGHSTDSGFHVTPLEILQAYGAIANEGRLMKPWSPDSDAKSDFGTADHNPNSGTVLKRPISADTAQTMKAILADVVKNGTGKNAQSLIYTTAGKTSTAYRSDSSEHKTLSDDHGIAGFVGFAPVQNSRLVVYVGIIDPTNSKDRKPHGGEHAAPVFREVVETVLKNLNVTPDK